MNLALKKELIKEFDLHNIAEQEDGSLVLSIRFVETVDALDFLNKHLGKWRKVDENDYSTYPEHCVGVLVLIPEEDNHVTAGMWDISNKWVLLDDYREPTSQVTHWRPMVDYPTDYQGYKKTHVENYEGVVTKLKKQLQFFLDKEEEAQKEFEEFDKKFNEETIEETDAYLREHGIDPDELADKGRVFIETLKKNIEMKHEIADLKLEIKKLKGE